MALLTEETDRLNFDEEIDQRDHNYNIDTKVAVGTKVIIDLFDLVACFKFMDKFGMRSFDVVIADPPWDAHAG
jgi:predicted methyltransferase